MSLDLDAIRSRANAATEGPWEIIGGGEYVTGVSVLIAPDDGGVSYNDADFIAHARTDVPALLAELDQAHAALAQAWDEGFKQGGPMHDVNYDDPGAHRRNPYSAALQTPKEDQ